MQSCSTLSGQLHLYLTCNFNILAPQEGGALRIPERVTQFLYEY